MIKTLLTLKIPHSDIIIISLKLNDESVHVECISYAAYDLQYVMASVNESYNMTHGH